MSSGCKVDSDLCGNVCASADQKQRTYAVTGDGEFIWCAAGLWVGSGWPCGGGVGAPGNW